MTKRELHIYRATRWINRALVELQIGPSADGIKVMEYLDKAKRHAEKLYGQFDKVPPAGGGFGKLPMAKTAKWSKLPMAKTSFTEVPPAE